MTLCPIALAVGCAKCPALSICPLKTILGDAPKGGEAPARGAEPGGDATRRRGKGPRKG